MFYFSDLEHLAVISEDSNKQLGKFSDLIFSFENIPYVRKIVMVKKPPSALLEGFNGFIKKREDVIIPIEDILKINGNSIVVKKGFREGQLEKNELYVRKNLLNTQILDIEGNNIVRVNDVLVQRANGHGMLIHGVDIGIAGILRWFKLEKITDKTMRFFGLSLPEITLAWSDIQPLELTEGRVVVKSRFNKLHRLHPADLADYLETQNLRNVLTIISGIDEKYLAQVISELNPNFQINLLKEMDRSTIALLLFHMDPDDAVDILSGFTEKRRAEILEEFPEKQASYIKKLMKFSGFPLGHLVNPKFLTVEPNQTAHEVIKRVRKEGEEFPLFHNIYVVNEEGHLIGVFNLQELLLQKEDTPVFKFMIQRVIVDHLSTPIDIAFRRMLKYKITSMPVIDNDKKMIGVISIDDIAENMLKRLTKKELGKS